MNDPMDKAYFLKNLIADKQTNRFRMEWEGTKIPRGAKINNTEIGWTQHGMVTGVDGSQLGTYDRLVEFGGKTGKSHVMVISTNHSEITPPPEGKVERVNPELGRRPS